MGHDVTGSNEPCKTIVALPRFEFVLVQNRIIRTHHPQPMDLGSLPLGRQDLIDAGGDDLAILDYDRAKGPSTLADILARKLNRLAKKLFKTGGGPNVRRPDVLSEAFTFL